MPQRHPRIWRRILNGIMIVVGFVLAAPLGLALAIFMILLWPHELFFQQGFWRRRARGPAAP